MKCQRSGSCCFSMFVVIRDGNDWRAKPGGILCPHVTWEETKAICGVHEEPWFTETPCHVYGNSDLDPDFEVKRGRPCVVGQFIQSKGGLRVVQDTPQAKMEDLELANMEEE